MNGNKNGFKAKSHIDVPKYQDRASDNEKSLSASNSAESLITNSEKQELKVAMEALERSASNLDLRARNKTFSNEKIRDIERKNSILMNKILAHTRRTCKFGIAPPNEKLSSSAVNRKKNDREIGQNNLVLLRKIQSVKPFGLSLPKR